MEIKIAVIEKKKIRVNPKNPGLCNNEIETKCPALMFGWIGTKSDKKRVYICDNFRNESGESEILNEKNSEFERCDACLGSQAMAKELGWYL